MAIALTLSNILQFFSFIAPTLLIFFLFLSSLFNQNLKGLVYIAGILIASTINIIFMNIVGSQVSDDASFSCNLFDIPHVSQYNSPYPSTLIIAFTIAYLVLPMKYNKQMNYVVLIFLMCLLGVLYWVLSWDFYSAPSGMFYFIPWAIVHCCILMNCAVIMSNVRCLPNKPLNARCIKMAN
jgi:hypothetical protein